MCKSLDIMSVAASEGSCKSCGGNDHSRASSSKCTLRILPQRKRFALAADGSAKEITSSYTLKRGLRKFCLDSAIRKRIDDDVREISALSEEASLYVFYHYTKLLCAGDWGSFHSASDNFSLNHLLDFYYHLQGKRQRKERVPLNEEYFALCKSQMVTRRYDGRLRSYAIQAAVAQHETAMKNCICVHLFARIVRYFRERYDKKTPWKRIVYEELFDAQTQLCRREEVDEFLRDFDLEGSADCAAPFANVEKRWWSFVPFTFRLGCWFADRKLRSFATFPILSSGRKHVRYTAMGLYELLTASAIADVPKNAVEFRAQTPRYWWRYFDLRKSALYGEVLVDGSENGASGGAMRIKTSRRRTRFGMSFSTNGVECSLLMERILQSTAATNKRHRKNSAEKCEIANVSVAVNRKAVIDNDPHDRFVGVDPGVVNLVACWSVDSPSQVNTDQLDEHEAAEAAAAGGKAFIIKSATFRQEHCRERASRHKRCKFFGKLEKEELDYRRNREEQGLSDITRKTTSVWQEAAQYVEYRLRFAVKRWKAYTHSRRLARLRWDDKICTRRGEDRLVEHIIDRRGRNETKNTLVCFGDGSRLETGVSYGARRRPPVQRLLAAFHRRRDKCRVLDVDEYMTTKCCSRCHSRMPLPRDRHRYQICPNCRTVWNRDANAAKNILKIALGFVDYRNMYPTVIKSANERVRSSDDSNDSLVSS